MRAIGAGNLDHRLGTPPEGMPQGGLSPLHHRPPLGTPKIPSGLAK